LGRVRRVKKRRRIRWIPSRTRGCCRVNEDR
jgi:hypothetical protein